MKIIHNAAKGPKRVELYYKGARRFSEESKAIYLKRIAGFWTYDIEIMVAGKPIFKSDHLEIKDNGIIWQVVIWKVRMPSDSNEIFYHIRTVYISPYGVVKGDTLSDAYILSQVFIGDGDTCFGGYNYSELWQTCRIGEELIVSKRNYRPYRGDIAAFFPPGAVRLVENSEKQLYYDTTVAGGKETKLNSVYHIRNVDPNSGKITLLPIRDSINNLGDFFRIKLANEYSAFKIRIHNQEEAVDLLGKYYQPFFIDEQWRLFPRAMPKTVQVSFIVRADGTIDSVQLLSPSGLNRMFSGNLIRELQSWRFPSTDQPIQVTYTFPMP